MPTYSGGLGGGAASLSSVFVNFGTKSDRIMLRTIVASRSNQTMYMHTVCQGPDHLNDIFSECVVDWATINSLNVVVDRATLILKMARPEGATSAG